MKVLVHDGLGIWLCARRLEQGKFHWAKVHQGESMADQPGAVTGTDPGFALAKNRTAASGNNALNQVHPFCYSPNVLFLCIMTSGILRSRIRCRFKPTDP